MRLPIVSGFLALPAASRKFLLFTAINVISWQCIVGQVLVLFSRAVDMPPAWVGLLLSFMPLSMLLVLFTVPLVEMMGPRRLLSWGWLLRNIIAMAIFYMPWAMHRWGAAGAWHILLFATFGFSFIRALSVGGWYPWLHEVVPAGQFGTYFSTESALVQLVNILLAIGLARILATGEGLGRFFWIYGIGISAGLFSVAAIRVIPGGRSVPAVNTGEGRFAAYRIALRDRAYVRFIVTVFFCFSALTWLSAAMIMYLRDMLGYSDTRIMYLICGGSLAIALTIGSWGRHADRFGSNSAMLQLLTVHSLIALSWLLLLPGAAWTAWLAVPVVILSTLFNATFAMVTSRSMLCHVRDQGRVGYTNIWIICLSLAQGLAPIAAGKVIDTWRMNGFRVCFLISGFLGLACVPFFSLLKPESGKPEPPHLHDVLRPGQPLRTLARTLWITLGFARRQPPTEIPVRQSTRKIDHEKDISATDRNAS